MDLPKAVLKVLKYKSKGFDQIISCDCPPRSGLGSSSAIVVTLIALMKKFLNLPLSSYDIAKMAVRVEREELLIKFVFQFTLHKGIYHPKRGLLYNVTSVYP